MPEETNYEESKVPRYTLPQLFEDSSGAAASTPAEWIVNRRPQLLRLFEEHVYGITPVLSIPMQVKSMRREADALSGVAVRTQAELEFSDDVSAKVLIYTPKGAQGEVPVYLGLNFNGNQTIHADPGIDISTRWMRESDTPGIVDHRATEASRGACASRWAVEAILDRGFGVATVYCGDFDPDYDDDFVNGIHGLFPRKTGDPRSWGTISAWAWGLSRTLDFLETVGEVDGTRVTTIGHSRLGKTALWAAAQDERFAAAISNCSGCGGAALSRRRFGETVGAITERFPHWFCSEFSSYAGREDAMPVDQHMLLALIAPRPLYVASAEEDLWADPRGEFLSAQHASAVYEMLGHDGLAAERMPDTDHPISGRVSYHVRRGGHDITPYDWKCYLDFVDQFIR